MTIKVHTIGFTKTLARDFFCSLKKAKASKIIDIRLNNSSQLSGYSKKEDLEYFTKVICDIDYIHLPELAPTKEILYPYQHKQDSWDVYQYKYMDLLEKRNIKNLYDLEFFDGGCFLCSEKLPHKCHRRLLVEYLSKVWNVALEVNHIV